MNRKAEKRNVYDDITARIITALDEGVIPWARPWDAARYGEHRNAVSNRPYRGLNILLLNLVAMLKGFADPRWLTFRNAEKFGGSIRKGEKGVQVIFWKFLPLRAEGDTPDVDPEPDEDRKQAVIPLARAYTVFNVEQCKGLYLPALEAGEVVDEENNELAERILTLPELNHGGGRACYTPSTDRITMPPRDTFENLNFYYGTAYHEIIHWTGHPARLARGFGNRFGDNAYAFEELVAEIGAAFLGSHTAIPFEEMRHPEYINAWLQIMKGDNKAIFTAAAKAQLAADFVLDRAGITDHLDAPLPVAA